MITCKETQFIPLESLSTDVQTDLYIEMCHQKKVLFSTSFPSLSGWDPTNTTVQIISHNAEGILSQFQQMLCDHVCLTSYIIILDEARTSSTDKYSIPGFSMVVLIKELDKKMLVHVATILNNDYSVAIVNLKLYRIINCSENSIKMYGSLPTHPHSQLDRYQPKYHNIYSYFYSNESSVFGDSSSVDLDKN